MREGILCPGPAPTWYTAPCRPAQPRLHPCPCPALGWACSMSAPDPVLPRPFVPSPCPLPAPSCPAKCENPAAYPTSLKDSLKSLPWGLPATWASVPSQSWSQDGPADTLTPPGLSPPGGTPPSYLGWRSRRVWSRRGSGGGLPPHTVLGPWHVSRLPRGILNRQGPRGAGWR